MRVLNLLASLNPEHGGPIEGALWMGDIWRSLGHEVDFATLDSPAAPYLAGIEGAVPLGALGRPEGPQGRLSLKERYGFAPRMVPWLRAHASRYDAVLVHALWNYTTVAARRVLVKSATPYFHFPHGSLDPWFRAAQPVKTIVKRLTWPFIEGPVMNHAAAVLFTTEEERRLGERSFRPYRIRPAVVGFGGREPDGDAAAQVAAFRAAVPALGTNRFLLFLSRIHQKKGCDLLIRAFAKVAGRHPDLDLVMAGPDQVGLKRELEEIARAAGVGSRVHWPGMIAGDVKWGAFRGCEAFALTSHTENFGIVVAEALAAGRPVLITDKVNLWREVAEDHAGLVEPDTQDGADRLLETFMALSADARGEMERQARACWTRHFRMESAAANIMALIEAAAATRPAG